MVETGDWNTTDVVVVQRAEREGDIKQKKWRERVREEKERKNEMEREEGAERNINNRASKEGEVGENIGEERRERE